MGLRFGTVTLAVGIGAGALAGVAIGAPLLASAAGTATPTPSASSPGTPDAAGATRPARLTELKAALKSLVTDGTITQAQADKIAARLDQALPQPGRDDDGPGGFRHGRHGFGGMIHGGLDAAAKVLGMTSDQVRAGLQSGKSLAQLAKDKGVAESKLVDALVAEATADVDQAVKDGRMSADLGTKIKSDLKNRIAAMVKLAPGDFRGGPIGGGLGGPMGGDLGGPMGGDLGGPIDGGRISDQQARSSA